MLLLFDGIEATNAIIIERAHECGGRDKEGDALP
jgi:hypothetical protein